MDIKAQLKHVMSQLESLGTEQNRKMYRRHGAHEPMFGVSFANLYKLRKHIGVNQELAEALWKTGNSDAEILAGMILDSSKFTRAQAEEWILSMPSKGIVDQLVEVVEKTDWREDVLKDWTQSDDESLGRAGWHLLARMAKKSDHDTRFFKPYIQIIENTIHQQKNNKKEAMNNALIAIGGRNKELLREGLRIARKIGKVDLDHGQTNCKTPDAERYMQKVFDYRHPKSNL